VEGRLISISYMLNKTLNKLRDEVDSLNMKYMRLFTYKNKFTLSFWKKGQPTQLQGRSIRAVTA
jgi:hypothetical protein